MRGKKARVIQNVFTEGLRPKARLKEGEVVTILSNEADSSNRVSIRNSNRYYPLHNIPLASLYLL